MRTGLKLTVLGELSVNGLDPSVAERLLGQPKRLSVLLYLALALPRGPRRRDELLPVFWPDSPRPRALTSLRKAIHYLRPALPGELLETRESGEISLNSELLRCDAVAFENSLDAGDEERALALYGGELLPAFRVTAAPEFERWLDGERLRLGRRAACAAWFLAARAADAGADPETVTAAVYRATRLGPHDEVAIRGGIRSLFRIGNRAAAADVYETLRQRLASDFQLEPAPETTNLFRDLAEGIRDGTSKGLSAETRDFSRTAGQTLAG